MELLHELEYDLWRDAAACVDTPDIDFFATPDNLSEIRRAKAVCAECPVRDECLAFAIETKQTEGIWGGATQQERVTLRRTWMRRLRHAS